MRQMTKQNSSKWPKTEVSFQQRCCYFLLRDLLPSLIILIMVILGTSVLAEKIYRAKAAKAPTVGMLEGRSPHPGLVAGFDR